MEKIRLKNKEHGERVERVTAAFLELTAAVGELEDDDVPPDNAWVFAHEVMKLGSMMQAFALMRGATPVEDEDEDEDEEEIDFDELDLDDEDEDGEE